MITNMANSTIHKEKICNENTSECSKWLKYRTIIFLPSIFYTTQIFYNEHVLLSEQDIILFQNTFFIKNKGKKNLRIYTYFINISVYQKKKKKNKSITSCLRVSLGNTSITDRRVSSHALLTPDGTDKACQINSLIYRFSFHLVINIYNSI